MELVSKAEVENCLGYSMTTEQFIEALEYAKRKQAYILEYEKNLSVLQRWYLIEMVGEYVNRLGFSKFTMDLCSELSMEKEHSTKSQSALTDNHIVTVPAL